MDGCFFTPALPIPALSPVRFLIPLSPASSAEQGQPVRPRGGKGHQREPRALDLPSHPLHSVSLCLLVRVLGLVGRAVLGN